VQFSPPIDAGAVVATLLNGTAPKATVVVALPEDLRALVTAAGATTQLSKDGGHAWMMTDIAKDPAIINSATLPQLVGSLGTAPAQGAGSAYPFFSDRFKARYGVDPADYSYTSHSYDAMYLVMLSAAWASQGGAAISGPRMNEGMHKVTGGVTSYRLLSVDWVSAVNALTSGVTIDVEGSSGKLDFDYDAGAPSAPYEVWRITPDGGFVTDRILQP
jgi:branched-chain amino acid transport system substrate-binding protein